MMNLLVLMMMSPIQCEGSENASKKRKQGHSDSLPSMSPIQCEGSKNASKKRKHGHSNSLPSVKITGSKPFAKGAFGTVYKALQANGDKVDKVVVKISRVEESDTDTLGIIRNEIHALAHLDHPNTLSSNHLCYFHQERTTIHVYTVLPRMQTDLRLLLRNSYLELWDLDEVKSCIEQIFAGMNYMHSRGIVHRDIKPPNILCSCIEGKWTFKVADFGMISTLQDCDDNWVCTLWYRAPELLVDRSLNQVHQYGVSMDLWSAGCVFAEVIQKLTGASVPLFRGKDDPDQLATIFNVRGPPSYDEKITLDWNCQPVNDAIDNARRKYTIPRLESILNANLDISAPVRNLLDLDPEKRKQSFDAQHTESTEPAIYLQPVELGNICTPIESQLKLPE